MLIYLLPLLVLACAIAIFLHLDRRARHRKLHDFAIAAGHTLQLESCGGIKPTNRYEYLNALVSAIRTQAMLRNLNLHPGDFERVVRDAIDSAYLLRQDEANKETARSVLTLFATCLDPIVSGAMSTRISQADASALVGAIGALTLLERTGWHAGSNADLMTCALTEAPLAKEVIAHWQTASAASREQLVSAFERVVGKALDPSTAVYVRQRVFSSLQGKA